MDKKTREIVEMVVNTRKACENRTKCEGCKHQFDGCYSELSEHGLADLIVELYKEVKINTDWGQQ